MVSSSKPGETAAVAALPAAQRWRRSRPELVVELVFRPLASVIVRLLLPLRVPPPTVVLANGIAGFAGVYLVARGDYIGGALLLQVKTILDNADGQLARRSGRTSAFGRYLDTEVDLLVNLALFAALGHVTGKWVLAVTAFVALTLVLSVDFNEDVMHRRTHGETVVTQPSTAGEARPACWLASAYGVLYGPQDRAIQGFAAKRLEHLVAGVSDPALRKSAALAYHDGFTSAVLANLGLSTQLAVLGLCLVLSAPEAYLWFALACVLVPVALQVRRELVVRRLVGG
jgi:archaetidylinositol phosphate synthase